MSDPKSQRKINGETDSIDEQISGINMIAQALGDLNTSKSILGRLEKHNIELRKRIILMTKTTLEKTNTLTEIVS